MKKNGWTSEEISLLNERAEAAKAGGETLASVFRETARLTGRQPNSVRNRYYAALRESGTPAAAFTPFTESEAEAVIGGILQKKASGCSVRRAALDLAGGDVSLMLRYQNKFRSICRKDPASIMRIAEKNSIDTEKLMPLITSERRSESACGEERTEALKAELKLQHERFMALRALFVKLCALDRELIARLTPKERELELEKRIAELSREPY